jgi:CDP-diacylglycerol--inositol 3-phosphatidyltransferase
MLTFSYYLQLSGLLDAVDGHAARLLNQSSKFGAMLDMLTDRCATMCLLGPLLYNFLRP